MATLGLAQQPPILKFLLRQIDCLTYEEREEEICASFDVVAKLPPPQQLGLLEDLFMKINQSNFDEQKVAQVFEVGLSIVKKLRLEQQVELLTRLFQQTCVFPEAYTSVFSMERNQASAALRQAASTSAG